MSIETLAKKFWSHCMLMETDKAEAFWSDDVVSLEPGNGPLARLEGRAAARAKGKNWYEANTLNSMTAEGPFIVGDQFALRIHLDFVRKAGGQRVTTEEFAIYTVKNDKIVEERFFY